MHEPISVHVASRHELSALSKEWNPITGSRMPRPLVDGALAAVGPGPAADAELWRLRTRPAKTDGVISVPAHDGGHWVLERSRRPSE